MRNIIIAMLTVPLLLSSCKDDEDTGLGNVTVTASVADRDEFPWPADSRAGVFSPEARAWNTPFTIAGSPTGTAQLTGALSWAPGENNVYSYYPYEPSNGNPSNITFFLNPTQEAGSQDKVFLLSEPLTADMSAGNNGVDIQYRQINGTIDFEITVPLSLPSGINIRSITVYAPEPVFYIQMFADLMENETSLPAVRSRITATDALTLVNGNADKTPAGSVFTASLSIIPDNYSEYELEVDIATDGGNYIFPYTIAGRIPEGGAYRLEYTLDKDNWYDPIYIRTSVKAEEALGPYRAPVTVGLANIVEAGYTPERIVMTPSEPGSSASPVTYTVTASDIANRSATISGTDLGNRPLPSTSYQVEVYADSKVVAQINMRTSDLSDDIQIVEAGSNLKSVVENAGRKTRIFLMPGTHYHNTSAINVTSDLVLTGDSPETTFIETNQSFAPSGSVDMLSFSNFRWNASGGFFVRPSANAASFNIENLIIEDCIFDFSQSTATTNILYFPQGSVAGYAGRLGNYVVNNTIFFAYGSDGTNNQALITTYGGDVYTQFGNITVSNSTFANISWGLITLPAGSGNVDQTERNGGVKPNISLVNNTFYKMGCNPNFGGASSQALIHTGSSNISMDCGIRMENNIFHFGGNNLYGIMNCTSNTGNNGTYSNNIGLESQPFRLMGSISPIPGFYVPFAGTIGQLFANPMDDPTAPGASFKVVGSGVVNAGDPRWN